MLGSSGDEGALSYTPIDSDNIAQFRTQNGLLFPITYPDAFYRNLLLHPLTNLAYLVYRGDSCVGSFSVRLEPLERWQKLVSGAVVDNFLPYAYEEIIQADRMCYIMTLGVLAVYRRLGLGALILKNIIRRAREAGAKCIGLHVHVDNRAALRFYESFGFSVLGRVKNYYRKITPNEAYILQLDLSLEQA